MDTESTVIKIIPGGSREEKGQDEGELAKSSTKPELKMASVQFLAGKICLNCHAHKTPLWRSGPYGTKTLCNACGVRHRYGRLPIYPLETVVLKAYEAFISPQWRQRTRESLAEEAAKQLQQSGEINPTKSSQPKKVLTEKRVRKKKMPSDFFIETNNNRKSRKKSSPVAIGIQMSEHDAASIILSLRNGMHHLPNQQALIYSS